MKQFALWLSAVAVLATAVGASHADYSLSITTNADANNLHVGDSVTLDVTLSGVATNDSTTYLSYLTATVMYDTTLLSASSPVTPGPIIPDTSAHNDISGFVDSSSSGAAGGFYEGYNFDNSNPVIIPISQSGVFFSFQVTPLQTGAGTLSFLFPGTPDSTAAATLASDPIQTDQIFPHTADLSFAIVASGAGTAVPEPSTFLLLISSMFGLSAGAGLRGVVRRVRLGK